MPIAPCKNHLVVLDSDPASEYDTCVLCGAPLPIAFNGASTAAEIAALATEAGVQIEMGLWDLPRPCRTCSGKQAVILDGEGSWIPCPDCAAPARDGGS